MGWPRKLAEKQGKKKGKAGPKEADGLAEDTRVLEWLKHVAEKTWDIRNKRSPKEERGSVDCDEASDQRSEMSEASDEQDLCGLVPRE